MRRQRHLPITQTNTINELQVIAYLCYAHKLRDRQGGGHFESLEGNVWQKSVLTSKKHNFGERSTLFRLCFIASPYIQPLQNDRWYRLANLSCWQTKTLVVDEMYADAVCVCHRFVVSLGTRWVAWRRSQSCDCVPLEKWNERSTFVL